MRGTDVYTYSCLILNTSLIISVRTQQWPLFSKACFVGFHDDACPRNGLENTLATGSNFKVVVTD